MWFIGSTSTTVTRTSSQMAAAQFTTVHGNVRHSYRNALPRPNELVFAGFGVDLLKGDVCLVDVFSFVFVHRKAVFGTQMCPLKPKIAFHVPQQLQDVPNKEWNWLLVSVHQQQRQTVFVLVCVRQVHRSCFDAISFDFLRFIRFLAFLAFLHQLDFLFCTIGAFTKGV